MAESPWAPKANDGVREPGEVGTIKLLLLPSKRLTNRTWPEVPLEQAALTKTSIFEEVEDGVMDAVNPVTSSKEAELVLKVSVLVVDTTCNTIPFGATPSPIEELRTLATVTRYTVISAPNTLILKRSAVVACLFTIIAPN